MAVSALLLSGAACGEDTKDADGNDERPSEATTALRAAAQATLAAPSMRIEVSGGEGGGSTVVDYNAPDRSRSVTTGEGFATETVVVGSSMYVSNPQQPGLFNRVETPGGSAVGEALLPLRALEQAADVQPTEGGFRFSLPRGAFTNDPMRGEVSVLDGRVAELKVLPEGASADAAVRYRFTLFGAAPAVESPPPQRVTTGGGASTSIPPCGTDGRPPPGATACGSFGRP